MKKFNVMGNCIPEENYMVDISGKIEQIKELIDNKYYFTINRGRQYGKTTTLGILERSIKEEYIVASISFQGIDYEIFESTEEFCLTIMELIQEALLSVGVEETYAEQWVDEKVKSFKLLSRHITKMCKDKEVILMIDEVDNASDNRVFLKFLNMLREKYIARRNGKGHTFHSVILAGVYDIKNMKLKMVKEGLYTPTADESKIYNSPWNIAADFNVDMSFSTEEISTMLKDYEADHNTGMDISAIANEIYNYTSGYPFMVSKVCQNIDKKLEKDWTVSGVQKAIKILLSETNMLFDDVFKNLENDKELYSYIYDLLILGDFKPYEIYDPIVSTGARYGFFKKLSNGNDRVAISNKIFELRMTDYYIAKDLRSKKQITDVLSHDIIKDGRFDMELCLRKFADHYVEMFNEDDIEFLERHGRLLFLSYLKPLVNGQGFTHIESQFTDLRRMDIVVDFGREQFIIELKRWKGEESERKAYNQLIGYMESKKAEKGYLLIFDFQRKNNKERKAEWVEIDGKKIFEVII
jgi:hypothetical protein